MKDLKHRIRVASGEEPADLLLTNGLVADVFTGEVVEASLAVADGVVAGVGDYTHGREVVDLKGLVVLPSFIDAHIHIESTMLDVPQFAAHVIPRGTGAVVADPHEIANVLGLPGVRYMLDAGKFFPFDLFVMVPSCVPATNLETSGASLGLSDISEMLSWDGVLGLGEMMNFPGVLACDEGVLGKILCAAGRPVDGHAPGLSGKALNAYVSAGMRTDHESVSAEEGAEKLSRGLHLLLREGSSERNLASLAPLVNEFTAPHTSLACDDRTALDLAESGHMDHCIRRAMEFGIPPMRAVAMATLHTARHYGLTGKGAVAPGYFADLACVGSLTDMDVRMVFHRGVLVARDGEAFFSCDRQAPAPVRNTVHVPTLDSEAFRVEAREGDVPVIEIVPGQIVTVLGTGRPVVREGCFLADPSADLLKLVVVERHTGAGGLSLGWVRGFGLQSGAMASSVAHDSHNLIAAGVDDRDIHAALAAVIDAEGGMAFARDGAVEALLPLPLAGLLSDLPALEVCDRVRALRARAARAGCTLEAPFATLSFLALPVIPEVRLTDLGLVDVMTQSFIG